MIYLDSFALFKLVVEEDESQALDDWLAERPDASLVSSRLATVEVLRACRRADESLLPAGRSLLATLDLVPLSGRLLDEAADLTDPLLRSLDALHLASALSLQPDLTAFVTYDLRLTAASEAVGLFPLRPGA